MFAVNSNEEGARNFTAFQLLAEQVNGTALGAIATNSAPYPSTTNSRSAAMRTRHIGGLLALALVAVGCILH